jgi:spore coat protein JB
MFPEDMSWEVRVMADEQQPVERPAPLAQRPDVGGEAYRRELEDLQKVDFVLVELKLYLDTHPTDMQAIQRYNQLVQRRQQLCYAFELRYGPLKHFGNSFSRFPWQWPETPWPWQV